RSAKFCPCSFSPEGRVTTALITAVVSGVILLSKSTSISITNFSIISSFLTTPGNAPPTGGARRSLLTSKVTSPTPSAEHEKPLEARGLEGWVLPAFGVLGGAGARFALEAEGAGLEQRPTAQVAHRLLLFPLRPILVGREPPGALRRGGLGGGVDACAQDEREQQPFHGGPPAPRGARACQVMRVLTER